MIEKGKLESMARFAQALDKEGEFEKADYVTEVMRKAMAGDEAAIREANALGDWWNNVKQDVGNAASGVWNAAKGVGNAVWNGAQAVGNGVYDAAKGVGNIAVDAAGLPIAAVQSVGQGIQGAFNNAVQNSQPMQQMQGQMTAQQAQMKQQQDQMNQIINSVVSNAMKAHGTSHNGWQVLMQQIAALPPALQEQAKQKFMAATKAAPQNVAAKPAHRA